MKDRMFISKTPLRITFVGGGSDIREYYSKYGRGSVLSAAINKFIYIVVNKKFDSKIRVSYSKTEIVDSVNKIEHPSVREALKLLEIEGGIEHPVFHFPHLVMRLMPSLRSIPGEYESFFLRLLTSASVSIT